MELTKKQFAKIEHLMPKPRKKPTISNYDFMRTLLYIKVHPDASGARKENGEQNIGRSKWGLQQRFIWCPRLTRQ